MLSSKKARSIAVSNFSPDQLDCILKNKTATVPGGLHARDRHNHAQLYPEKGGVS